MNAMLHKLARYQFARLLAGSGLLSRARRQAARQGIVVLTFHRVVPDAEMERIRSPRGMVIRESLFIALLGYLSRYAEVISASAISRRKDAWLPTGEPAKRPRVLLTFDDGWRDNFTVAWPHLHRAGMDAIFFVTTGKLGEPAPFWPEQFTGIARAAAEAGLLAAFTMDVHAFAQHCEVPAVMRDALLNAGDSVENTIETAISLLKLGDAAQLAAWLPSMKARYGTVAADALEALCTWPELRSMMQEGAVIASHTAQHTLLTQCSEQMATMELAQSRHHVAAHGGCSDLIAYPNGDASAATTRLASLTGYRLGFLNTAGIWSKGTDPLLIPRVNLWDGKLAGADGQFSRMQLEYSLYWKALRKPRYAAPAAMPVPLSHIAPHTEQTLSR